MTESHEKSGQAPAQSSITTVSCFGTDSHDTSERRAGLLRYTTHRNSWEQSFKLQPLKCFSKVFGLTQNATLSLKRKVPELLPVWKSLPCALKESSTQYVRTDSSGSMVRTIDSALDRLIWPIGFTQVGACMKRVGTANPFATSLLPLLSYFFHILSSSCHPFSLYSLSSMLVTSFLFQPLTPSLFWSPLHHCLPHLITFSFLPSPHHSFCPIILPALHLLPPPSQQRWVPRNHISLGLPAPGWEITGDFRVEPWEGEVWRGK